MEGKGKVQIPAPMSVPLIEQPGESRSLPSKESVLAASTGGEFELGKFRRKPGIHFEIRDGRSLNIAAMRKPPSHQYWRGCPNNDYSDVFSLLATDAREDAYLLGVEVADHLHDIGEPACKDKRLRLVAFSNDTFAIVPFAVPDETGRLHTWALSAEEIWDASLTQWVRMSSSMPLGRYTYQVARGDLGEPEWPTQSFAELMEMAFRGLIIESLDHIVLRRLRGEVR